MSRNASAHRSTEQTVASRSPAILSDAAVSFWQGISLGAAVAMTLSEKYDRDVGFCYDRKEKKDHGEKGQFVGAEMRVNLSLVNGQLLIL